MYGRSRPTASASGSDSVCTDSIPTTSTDDEPEDIVDSEERYELNESELRVISQ